MSIGSSRVGSIPSPPFSVRGLNSWDNFRLVPRHSPGTIQGTLCSSLQQVVWNR